MRKSIRFAPYFYDEDRDMRIYEKIESLEKKASKRKIIKKIKEQEVKHREFWRKMAERNGEKVKEKKYWLSVLFYTILYKFLGADLVIKLSEISEKKAVEKYYSLYTSSYLSEEERRKLKEIMLDEISHEEELLSMHKKSNIIEHIRDIFLGMNDGLVEILATLAGLVSLNPFNNTFLIGITGIIVGLSGTLSMAVGNYISVKNQRDVKARKNFEVRIVNLLTRRRRKEEEVVENPIKSAYLTGLFYILGTVIVVYPFFILSNSVWALILSIISATLAWIVAGIIIGLSSSLSIRRKIVEMTLIGLGSAFISYMFGYVLHVLIG